MCHNYSNGARRCLENWQRSNSLERRVWFIINHPSCEDYYKSWRKTDRNFLRQTSKSPRGGWMPVSLFPPREAGGRPGPRPASRGGPAAALSSALLRHPRPANTRRAPLVPIEASRLCFYCQWPIQMVLLETSEGTLTWKLSSLQRETK